jgi:hypothetical protein
MQIDHIASDIPSASSHMKLADALIGNRKRVLDYCMISSIEVIFQPSGCCGTGTAADGLLIVTCLRPAWDQPLVDLWSHSKQQVPGRPTPLSG